jgi:hypothetical protein
MPAPRPRSVVASVSWLLSLHPVSWSSHRCRCRLSSHRYRRCRCCVGVAVVVVASVSRSLSSHLCRGRCHRVGVAVVVVASVSRSLSSRRCRGRCRHVGVAVVVVASVSRLLSSRRCRGRCHRVGVAVVVVASVSRSLSSRRCRGRCRRVGVAVAVIASVSRSLSSRRCRGRRRRVGSPTPHPRRRDKPHPPSTRIVLPVLVELTFQGVSEWLEVLVARIDAPLLNNINTRFFNQLIFDSPQVARLIGRIELSRPSTLSLSFDPGCQAILFYSDDKELAHRESALCGVDAVVDVGREVWEGDGCGWVVKEQRERTNAGITPGRIVPSREGVTTSRSAGRASKEEARLKKKTYHRPDTQRRQRRSWNQLRRSPH